MPLYRSAESLAADAAFAAAYDTAGAAATAQAAAIAVSAQRASNLSDLASPSTARTSLGLGSAATMTPAGIAADTALTGAFAPLAEDVNVVGASGASQTLPDPSTYGVSDVTLTASCTFTMPTVAAAGASKSFMVVLVQGGSGSYTPTFTGATWPDGTAPSWSTVVGSVDQVMFSSTNGRPWVGAALTGLAAP
jgi:hypothetical protein